MKSEIKQLWIDALRSGDYEQGVGNLHQVGEYCCLGVLMDLACKAEIAQEFEGEDGDDDDCVGYYTSRDPLRTVEYYSLTREVMEWAGLPVGSHEGLLPTEIIYAIATDDTGKPITGKGRTLVSLNDQAKYTFSQIADVIEAQF